MCLGTEGAGEDPCEPLKGLFRSLPQGHPARSRASQFISSGGNELRSIVSTLKVNLRIYASAPIARMVSGDDIDPSRILSEKTALFLHVMDEGLPLQRDRGGPVRAALRCRVFHRGRSWWKAAAAGVHPRRRMGEPAEGRVPA